MGVVPPAPFVSNGAKRAIRRVILRSYAHFAQLSLWFESSRGRPLLLQLFDLTGDSRDHQLHRRGRGNDHGLLAERREDLVDQRLGIAPGMGPSEPQHPRSTISTLPRS